MLFMVFYFVLDLYGNENGVYGKEYCSNCGNDGGLVDFIVLSFVELFF